MTDARERTQTASISEHRRSGSGLLQATLRVLFNGTHGILLSPRCVLRSGELVLGRDVSEPELAGLRDDSSVSRKHAVLHVANEPGVSELVDAESRNGTFVNGVPTSRCVLSDGDVIRLGNSILLFRREPAHSEDAHIESLVGRSPEIRTLRALLERVARTPATLLLLGESGVGKSLTARAVHDRSGRPGRFVAVNCAAIPESLAESQLFGHVAGSFTGAVREHEGFFRAAHGGTLFLDEIAELAPVVQAKLLGVLEERVVRPVGGVQPIACDVRLVAATNANLDDAVAQRMFRGDLLARVSEVVITIPPLRARREDILPLFAASFGGEIPKMSSALAAALASYGWPYNVRELTKVAMDLNIRGEGQQRLELEMIADRIGADRSAPASKPPPPPTEPSARPPIPTQQELEQLLRDNNGMISEVAARTGRSRKQVYRWLAHYQLDADRFRTR